MIETSTIIFSQNETFADASVNSIDGYWVRIIQSSVASVGIIANLTVIVVFLNHKKLRGKIPNIFIINQVRVLKIDTVIKRKLTIFVTGVSVDPSTPEGLTGLEAIAWLLGWSGCSPSIKLYFRVLRTCFAQSCYYLCLVPSKTKPT